MRTNKVRQNDKAKFQAARELITTGRYEEAKEILSQIDSPTAKVWISKLDERIQHRKTVQQLKRQATRKTKLKKSLTVGNIIAVGILWMFGLAVMLGALGFLWAFASPSPSYIVDGSSLDNRNRIFQIVLFVVFSFVSISAFKMGWDRISRR